MPDETLPDIGQGTAKRGRCKPLAQLLKPYLALWPMIIGVTFARSGVIVGSYGSYAGTDAGLITDSATMISMSGMLVLLAVIVARNSALSSVRSIRCFAYSWRCRRSC